MKRTIAAFAFASVLFATGLFGTPTAAAVDGEYDSFLSAVEQSAQAIGDSTKPEDAARGLYDDTGLPSLLNSKSDFMLEEYTDDVLQEVTFSQPLPILVNKELPESEDTSAFVESLTFNDRYAFIVYQDGNPIAVMTIKGTESGYEFVSIAGRDSAQPVYNAMSKDEQGGKTTPLYLFVFTNEFLLHGDDNITPVSYGQTSTSNVTAKAATASISFDALSNAVNEYVEYAKDHPEALSGGLEEFLDRQTTAQLSYTHGLRRIAMAGAALLAVVVYAFLIRRRQHSIG